MTPVPNAAASPSAPLSGEVAETASVECSGFESQGAPAIEPELDAAEPEAAEALVRKARV